MKILIQKILSKIWKNFLVIPLLALMFSAQLKAQDEILNDLLNTANLLNETLLELTALSDEDENLIGDELDKQISKDLLFTKAKKFNIKNIFNKLMKNIQRTSINYSYKVVRTDEVNAYAIAGGRMYINTGIIDFLDNEYEIAFVLAHEISHNELRHCIKRVQYAAIASSIDPNLGEIVQVAYGMYSMPFTKYDEFEADELGAKLMKKAGYNISGAVSFFEKLEKLEKEYGMDQRDPVNDFISSHPTAKERRNRVKKM